MKLIVGLGNPGGKYRLTRHNAGFMIVEGLARANRIRLKRNRRFKAVAGKGFIEGEKSYLALPQTFMNLSGYSVCIMVKWLKLELERLLVVVDDIALPFGSIRIRARGSDAGHKGMRSIIDLLGTEEFARMRIGILGRTKIGDCSRYVLNRFTGKEQKALPDILTRAAEACGCWAKEGIEAAMNQFNLRSKNHI